VSATRYRLGPGRFRKIHNRRDPRVVHVFEMRGVIGARQHDHLFVRCRDPREELAGVVG
jgi:hypothetical protein